MNRLWILGAPDPEMEAIENLLRERGETVTYATSAGVRVHPGNAYRADVPDVPADSEVYAVECIDVLPEGWVRIDHHRPGDPGFGRPPEEFLEASSLGQVIHALCIAGVDVPTWTEYCPLSAAARRVAPQASGLCLHEFMCSRGYLACVDGGDTREVVQGVATSPDEYGTRLVVACRRTLSVMRYVPSHLVLTSAADHCLGAAYAGKCPGVDPVALGEFRAAERARFSGRDVSDVLADIAETSAALAGADILSLGTIGVADMRRSEGPWPELPEAATRAGISYISGPLDCPDGRQKVTCSGTREVVEAFMREWGPSQGLTDIYGDPARGFAGGYLA